MLGDPSFVSSPFVDDSKLGEEKLLDLVAWISLVNLLLDSTNVFNFGCGADSATLGTACLDEHAQATDET